MSRFKKREVSATIEYAQDNDGDKVTKSPNSDYYTGTTYATKCYPMRLSKEDQVIFGQELANVISHISASRNGDKLKEGCYIKINAQSGEFASGTRFQVVNPPRYNGTFKEYAVMLKQING